jgi:hypothetical protein
MWFTFALDKLGAHQGLEKKDSGQDTSVSLWSQYSDEKHNIVPPVGGDMNTMIWKQSDNKDRNW